MRGLIIPPLSSCTNINLASWPCCPPHRYSWGSVCPPEALTGLAPPHLQGERRHFLFLFSHSSADLSASTFHRRRHLISPSHSFFSWSFCIHPSSETTLTFPSYSFFSWSFCIHLSSETTFTFPSFMNTLNKSEHFMFKYLKSSVNWVNFSS